MNSSLPDPFNDRKVKELQRPPNKPLESHLMYSDINDQQNSRPKWEMIRDHLIKEGRILKSDFLKILRQSVSIL